jgi:hypothetical protein
MTVPKTFLCCFTCFVVLLDRFIWYAYSLSPLFSYFIKDQVVHLYSVHRALHAFIVCVVFMEKVIVFAVAPRISGIQTAQKVKNNITKRYLQHIPRLLLYLWS